MEDAVLTVRGPLGQELAGVSLAIAPADGPSAPDNPAEVLAALMDFPGGVALAELLDTPLPEKRSASGEPRTGLLADVRARLGALEPLALRPLVGRRAHVLPTAEEIHAMLAQHQLVEERSPERTARFADELGDPLRAALSTSLRQAQAHVSTLRWQIAQDLRALGPTAEQIERLDAALSRSISAKLGELFDRMEHAAHLMFVRAASHAVQELPAGATAADLASWVEPGGWITRYRERAVRMARALFGHLRRNVEGLVRAAAHAEGL